MFFDVVPSAMVPDIVSIGRDWQPDLIVHEEGSAGPIAAAVLGIPSVGHGFGNPLGTLESMQARDEMAAPLWRKWGLEPAPFGGLFRYLYLDPCPPSLQAPHVSEFGVVHPLRSSRLTSRATKTCRPGSKISQPQPIVYATMGTVPGYNRAPAVWEAILTGLASQPLSVILTLGPGGRPFHARRVADECACGAVHSAVVTHPTLRCGNNPRRRGHGSSIVEPRHPTTDAASGRTHPASERRGLRACRGGALASE